MHKNVQVNGSIKAVDVHRGARPKQDRSVRKMLYSVVDRHPIIYELWREFSIKGDDLYDLALYAVRLNSRV